MPEPLNANQRRVLGVLIEKHLSQPTYYPMTLNAIVTGCNQKSNRDPVTSLREDEVHETLEDLKARGLVTMDSPGLGSRVAKYKEQTLPKLGWEKRDRAVMAELLLRGPQTQGELRTRCQRMTAFPDLAAVEETLEKLSGGDDPYVRVLPKSPGQSVVRFRHLLYKEGEAEVRMDDPATAPPPAEAPSAPVSDYREQLAALQEEVIELRGVIESMSARLVEVEGRLRGTEGDADLESGQG